MNNHQQTELMIVKHVLLKKCIENSIDNKNTDVKMWREQFFQSYYCRRLLRKNELNLSHVVQPSFATFQKNVSDRKSLFSSSYMCSGCELRIWLFCNVFPFTMGHDVFTYYLFRLNIHNIFLIWTCTTLQSKHRLVHSSPASPDHLTSVPLTSFQ